MARTFRRQWPAISGVLAARGEKVDLFGVLVLALVTSFGDGTAPGEKFTRLATGKTPVIKLPPLPSN